MEEILQKIEKEGDKRVQTNGCWKRRKWNQIKEENEGKDEKNNWEEFRKETKETS